MPVNVNITKDTGGNASTPDEGNPGKVSISVNKGTSDENNPAVSIKINDNKKSIKNSMNFKKAINGDIMIFDHKDIDIIILKEQKKVVAFAKDMLTDSVYGAETRLFTFLRKNGIIAYDSIKGGNIYGSMEAAVLTPEDNITKPIALTVHMIQEWMKEEKPMMDFMDSHEDMMDDALLNPDDEHATELGEVPHEEEKGSILQKNMFAPYMYGRYLYQ
tara:strand:+ start:1134 stop:1784 length:651 start_codon:yes stop_codon:yes gene_type:complete